MEKNIGTYNITLIQMITVVYIYNIRRMNIVIIVVIVINDHNKTDKKNNDNTIKRKIMIIKGSWEAILPCYGQIEF
jgi:hypothetical protein